MWEISQKYIPKFRNTEYLKYSLLTHKNTHATMLLHIVICTSILSNMWLFFIKQIQLCAKTLREVRKKKVTLPLWNLFLKIWEGGWLIIMKINFLCNSTYVWYLLNWLLVTRPLERAHRKISTPKMKNFYALKTNHHRRKLTNFLC